MADELARLCKIIYLQSGGSTLEVTLDTLETHDNHAARAGSADRVICETLASMRKHCLVYCLVVFLPCGHVLSQLSLCGTPRRRSW
jgi:hypothetical protein